LTVSSKRLWKGDRLGFFLIVGSDGFWETSAFTAIRKKLESLETPTTQQLVNLSSGIIGNSPHDDSTLVIIELEIDKEALIGKPLAIQKRQPTITNSLCGSSDGESAVASSVKRKGRRRSASNDHRTSANLDYLFS
jgi:serine/threonine protein phosphatase PrpC